MDDHFLPADPTERVALAFSLIGGAYHLLRAFPYAEALRSFDRQLDAAWYVDPTTMRNARREDIDRKRRLMRAAAAFVATIDAVESELAPEAPNAPPAEDRGGG